MNPRKYT